MKHESFADISFSFTREQDLVTVHYTETNVII